MGRHSRHDGSSAAVPCRRCSERLVSSFCVGFVVFAVARVWRGEVVELFGDVVSAGVRVSGLNWSVGESIGYCELGVQGGSFAAYPGALLDPSSKMGVNGYFFIHSLSLSLSSIPTHDKMYSHNPIPHPCWRRPLR